ncbi:hypothetical protein CVT91_03180 [Candidatus Atribacteria bacterium HGW-Atribacteria-1]|nr:MAG: hypothetical protein CVT91_03180 [Candidatus Atribacteria bacterium HGW-Atribacteria-1]
MEGLKSTSWLFQYFYIGLLAWFIVKIWDKNLTLKDFPLRFCIYLLGFIIILRVQFLKDIFPAIVFFMGSLEIYFRYWGNLPSALYAKNYSRWILILLVSTIFSVQIMSQNPILNKPRRDIEWENIMGDINVLPVSSLILYPLEKFDEYYGYAQRPALFDSHLPTYNRLGLKSRQVTLDMFDVLDIKNRVYYVDELMVKWDKLTSQQIRRIQKIYPVTHIIRYRDQEELPYAIYSENKKYIVYLLN